MKKILFATTLLSLSATLYSQDVRTWNASVGVGLGVKKNLRKENRYEDMDKSYLIKTIPFVTGNIGRLSLGAQGISFMAAGNHMINGSVFITRKGDKYQGYDMAPRKESAFVGASFKFIKYGLSVSHDINGRSKGWTTEASYGEFFKLSDSFMLRAGLSIDWNDDRYAEYYYGVRKSEAKADRREYHVKNYILPGVSLMPIYKFTEELTLTTVLGAKLLPKKISDSPIMTGSRFEFGGLVGISYKL